MRAGRRPGPRRPRRGAEALRHLLEGAGFAEVAVRAEQHEIVLTGPDEWWAWKWSYSLRGVLEQLSDERVDHLRREARAHLDGLGRSEGHPLTLTALMATGRS